MLVVVSLVHEINDSIFKKKDTLKSAVIKKIYI